MTESVQQLVSELGGTPLIGFAGAPFTVASYLVEGGPSKDHAKTKALMHGDPKLWHALADRLADVAIAYLSVQIEAGASAIQLFDSWAGGAVAARLRASSSCRTRRRCSTRWRRTAYRGCTSA